MAKILVVDDIIDNIKLLKLFLEDDGYKVVTANDGLQALEVAETEIPDIILMDIMMPRMNGIEACKKLKESPCLAEIPVIMVSAADAENDIINGLDAGAHDYITKPINYFTVAARIRSALRVKEYQDSIKDLNSKLVIEKNKAETALKVRSAFLATMSHEIRTPITAIMGMSEILKSEDELKLFDNAQAANAIFNNSRYLLDVINNILDLSKVESCGMEIEILDCSLFEIISATKSIVELKAKEKNINLYIEYDFPIPEKIKTDSTRLKQVLVNLIGNAIKFTEEGFVNLKVSFDLKKGELKLTIIDTGMGMTKKEQEKLFQPFQQANKTINRKFGGTGLGLTISKEIVTRLNGEINVDSQRGNGSTFTVTLPITISDNCKFINNEYTYINDNGLQESYCFNGRVLLIEDEPTNQKIVEHTLKKVGVEIEIAKDGELGLEKASNEKFDLILMDVNLPKLDGHSIIKMLNEKGIKTPIVGLTASGNSDDLEALIHLGCKETLSKPFQQVQMYECVKRYLSVCAEEQSETKINSLNKDEEYIELIANYIKQLSSRLETIEQAFRDEQWDTLRGQAHKLIGAGLFGLTKVSLQAKFLEDHAAKKDKKACRGVLIRLKEEITTAQSTG